MINPCFSLSHLDELTSNFIEVSSLLVKWFDT